MSKRMKSESSSSVYGRPRRKHSTLMRIFESLYLNPVSAVLAVASLLMAIAGFVGDERTVLFEGSTIIEAHYKNVFDHVGNLSHIDQWAPGWHNSVSLRNSTNTKVGDIYRGLLQVPGGLTEYTMRVEEYEEYSTIAWSTDYWFLRPYEKIVIRELDPKPRDHHEPNEDERLNLPTPRCEMHYEYVALRGSLLARWTVLPLGKSIIPARSRRALRSLTQKLDGHIYLKYNQNTESVSDSADAGFETYLKSNQNTESVSDSTDASLETVTDQANLDVEQAEEERLRKTKGAEEETRLLEKQAEERKRFRQKKEAEEGKRIINEKKAEEDGLPIKAEAEGRNDSRDSVKHTDLSELEASHEITPSSDNPDTSSTAENTDIFLTLE